VLLLAVGLVATGSTAVATPGAGGGSDVAPCVQDPREVITAKLPESATAKELPDRLANRLDAAAEAAFEAEEGAAPGAIVGVRTPKGTFIEAYGVSDRDTGVPMTTDLHMRIGSVTKTFTGTVILQLAEDGKLSLDDPIDEYVPGVPNGDRITLRLLADMTSGVASYSVNPAFGERLFGDPEGVTFTPDELVAYGLADSPIFEPGAMYNYSNTNFILLGKVIEEVTGRPVFDVIRRRIIKPLGLSETSWPGDTTELPSPYAEGYTLQGNEATPELPDNATHWNPSWAWTAGGLVSTMDDLLTYDRALGTGQGLLDRGMQTERLTSFPPSSDYAYGLALGCVGGWVGHTGELPGYNTSLYYDTTRDFTVVVMTNSDIASGACTESPTLALDPQDIACSGPSTRIEVALSEALGHPFTPPAQN
jgi:D-alanyl-D-alanine carboxypeptidase